MTDDTDETRKAETDAPQEATGKDASRTKRTWRDPAERLEEIKAELARVRAREQKSLIQIADKMGYFRYRFSKEQAQAMFTAAINGLEPRKLSTLAKREQQVSRLQTRIAKAARVDDARRKALLGGFVVAQCRHKPEFHAAIVDDIRAFLAEHLAPKVAASNLTLLEGFLGDPASTAGNADPNEGQKRGAIKSEHRDRAHRLILLGAWVLARQSTRADLALLISEELGRFLDQGQHADRHRKLLQDVLP